ncbi:unnamed protein product [Pelagomonas calceolata]|uniref:DUF547 domain-containing protein n=1 Tax=Pelagomonas calceolata TaxID=35677 RepID=A0A8J2WXB0_9STRA|nr:unnamed protein product [Pelagomonas calceolata]
MGSLDAALPALLQLAVLVLAGIGALAALNAYARPARDAATAWDDGAALRCAVDDTPLVPDGSSTRIETSRLVGEVRFVQRREGTARCAVALAARPTAPLPPRLWFGVEVAEGESEPPRALRALAGTLLTLARRLMGTEVRCELNTVRPLIAFDVASAATRFEAWPCAAPAPLDAADGAPAEGPAPVEADRARVLAAVKEGRHLALAWYTTYVDFEKWSCVGLPAWLGGEVPIARLWGNRGLRLVLFGDGPDGARDYWLEINVDRATKPRPPPPRGLDVLNAAAGPRSRSLCVDVAALPGLLLKRLLGEGRDDSAALAFVDRSALAALSDDERLAFALNLYHLCIAAAQRSGRYVIWGRDVPWFRRRPPFLALARLGADALRRASVDVGGVYVTPLALEHGWLRGATPQRSFAALALAGKPPNPLAPWEPPDVDACLALALQSGVAACGPAAVPVYAAATVRAQLRETARRVCIAFAPRLPPVCRYHAHAFGVDRARVAFAVASLAGGGISLDARPAPFSCAPALLELLDEDGGERVVR